MRVDPLQILTKLAAVQNIPTRRVTPPLRGWKSLTTACGDRWTPSSTGRSSAAAAGQHP